jgi:hypothetical protein
MWVPIAGAALVGWILVKLLVMQRYFFLQPVIAALGIAELALVRVWQQDGSAIGVPPAAPARAARLMPCPVRLRRGYITMTGCPSCLAQ